MHTRAKPAIIKSENDSEFVGKVMGRWAYEHGIEMNLSRPGKPTNNVMGESVNGRLRQDYLNQHRFPSLDDARAKIEAWRREYGEPRLHSALD